MIKYIRALRGLSNTDRANNLSPPPNDWCASGRAKKQVQYRPVDRSSERYVRCAAGQDLAFEKLGFWACNIEVGEDHSFFVGRERACSITPVVISFRAAGVEIRDEHFTDRFVQRVNRGITEKDALDVYRNGRVFVDPESKNFIRRERAFRYLPMHRLAVK
jgi:hypothetical protein